MRLQNAYIALKVIGFNSYPDTVQCENGGSDGREGDKIRGG